MSLARRVGGNGRYLYHCYGHTKETPKRVRVETGREILAVLSGTAHWALRSNASPTWGQHPGAARPEEVPRQ